MVDHINVFMFIFNKYKASSINLLILLFINKIQLRRNLKKFLKVHRLENTLMYDFLYNVHIV